MSARDGAPAPDSVRRDVLIIGLGNPILGDDGVGWKVARQVSSRIKDVAGIEVDYMAVGGLGLMERVLGYRRVILVDSIETGMAPEGTVSSFLLDELATPHVGHSASAHDASLTTALQAAKEMGASVPQRIEVVAVEIRGRSEFSEELTPRIAEAVPATIEKVLALLHSR